MSETKNVNSWLFQRHSNRDSNRNYDSRDHLSKEHRNLLNQHLDGVLTKSEPQEKLLELKANGQD